MLARSILSSCFLFSPPRPATARPASIQRCRAASRSFCTRLQNPRTCWLGCKVRSFPPGRRHLLKSGMERALLPDFAASADPAVSFDGEQRVVCRESSRDRRLADLGDCDWRVGRRGGSPRRTEDCIRPFYLPDDRIVYARKIEGRFVIEVKVHRRSRCRLTYSPGSALPTDILHDGRILFDAAYPLGPEFS